MGSKKLEKVDGPKLPLILILIFVNTQSVSVELYIEHKTVFKGHERYASWSQQRRFHLCQIELDKSTVEVKHSRHSLQKN